VFAFDPHNFCKAASDEQNDGGKWKYACPEDEEDWPDFFQLPVLMLMLITLLNDGTLISVGYDNVKPSPRPGEPRPTAACQPGLGSAAVAVARLSSSPSLQPTGC
jgi:hypothetical protein